MASSDPLLILRRNIDLFRLYTLSPRNVLSPRDLHYFFFPVDILQWAFTADGVLILGDDQRWVGAIVFVDVF